MTFPTGYTKYQEVTIDSSKVPADQIDFPIYIDLSEMLKAGADIFDSCRADGGDIRVTKSDGTTQLPREVVAIDTGAKTGELHIKYTGTLSSSSPTVIRIYYNGTDTEPASTATYGSQNVWTGYEAVLHMQSSSVDSTGSGNDGTDTNISYVSTNSLMHNSGLFSNASASKIIGLTPIPTGNATKSFSVWFRTTNNSLRQWIVAGGSDVNQQAFGLFHNGSPNAFVFHGNGGAYDYQFASVPAVNTNHLIHITFNGSTLSAYANGSLDGSKAMTLDTVGADTQLGRRNDNTASLDGQIGEFRITTTVLSSTWITTEHNNQSSPSTFYAVGEEQGEAVGRSFAQII